MENHTITWRDIAIAITFTPEKFGGWDHIELNSENKAALPVTETGYRSYFLPKGVVAEYGGAVKLITEWRDHEATRAGWTGQLALF